MKIEIVEVGPRDGLQNENQILSSSVKSKLIKKLSEAGLQNIEVGAFVSSKWVPQMADSLKVAKSTKTILQKNPKLKFSALVPNERGLTDFLKSPLKEASIFAACTESFSQKNINCSVDESFERFKPILLQAKKNKVKVRAYLSTVFGCPFEGKVSTKKVTTLTHRLLEAGAYEVSLGDTIGVATPKQIKNVVNALLKSGVKPQKLAGHFHDTRGTALSNVLACIDLGLKKFDSCVGGLGGCPYAPGAAGNLATEDLVYTLHEMGFKTGVDLEKLIEVARWLQTQVGHPISSHLSMSGV